MTKKNNSILKGIVLLVAAVCLMGSATFMYGQTDSEAQLNADRDTSQTDAVRVQVKDRIQETKEKVQEKVSQIKDKAKRSAAEKITARFEHINEVWTNHFNNVLDRLETVLEKIKSRRDKVLVNGEDVALVDAAIKKAEDAIDEARLAVDLQSEKTYVIDVLAVKNATANVSSQQNLMKELKEQFTLLRNQLFPDLMGLRDGKIKNSKTEVHGALQSLSQIPNVDDEP